MTRFKLAMLVVCMIVAVWASLMICPYFVKADPPHPRTHQRWYARANQTVVLVFIRRGVVERWMYGMVHEAEPARDCTHSYNGMENGHETFTLVTYDMTHPYRYTMYSEPIMRYDNIQKRFVKIRKGEK